MKRNSIRGKAASSAIFLALLPVLVSWGIFGHEHINHAAVLALPQPLQMFFYNHIDFITQESTVPDLRKHTLSDKNERPRHFINLENFGSRDTLPRSFADARKKCGEQFLSRNGILPWYLDSMMQKLTKAFKEKRKTEILFLAADLGHYIGDAHMPLHASANHDGELTEQRGIHAFWEAQLPDLFGKSYNFKVSPATYIGDVNKEIWNLVFSSNLLADTMLLIEKKLSASWKARIYEEDSSGNIRKNKFGQPVHSNAYATEYHRLLNGMVEKQMRKAILTTASFWYTAWVNAGKPDLSNLDPKELTQQNTLRLQTELRLWNEGKLYGVESESEF